MKYRQILRAFIAFLLFFFGGCQSKQDLCIKLSGQPRNIIVVYDPQGILSRNYRSLHSSACPDLGCFEIDSLERVIFINGELNTFSSNNVLFDEGCNSIEHRGNLVAISDTREPKKNKLKIKVFYPVNGSIDLDTFKIHLLEDSLGSEYTLR
ncbi:MAG: hypothetical protein SFY70_04240 [Bacteroidia bacterium]|nr:hypothetical protein [Bacteroidia bacterium]